MEHVGQSSRLFVFCGPMTIALGFAAAIARHQCWRTCGSRQSGRSRHRRAECFHRGNPDQLEQCVRGETPVVGQSRKATHRDLSRIAPASVDTRFDGYEFILKSEKGGAVITVLESGKAIGGASSPSEGAQRRADAAGGSSAGPLPTPTFGEGPCSGPKVSAGPMSKTMFSGGPSPVPSTSTGPMPMTPPGEGPRPKP